MIRNKKIKKFLIDTVFPVFTIMNKLIPKNDKSILIYCANDELNDNSKALYEYLIEKKYYKKYKIYCSLKNYKNYESPCLKRVIFISPISGIWQYMLSKYMFYSMGKIPIKPTKKQMVINMWHGIPFKTIGKLSNINNGYEFFFTYVCASSELYRPIMAKAFGCDDSNVCICGEPKTDRLFQAKKIENKYKLIVWTPTFRQSQYLGYDDSKMASFLPFIENNSWYSLNQLLKEKNIKLIAKLHPVQNLNGFKEKIYSNFEIYSDSMFRMHKYNLYELLSQSNALITDYSSVYLEYLLLNRPIGFALGDIEEYQNKRGFVFDKPLEYMPGMKMYNKDDLFAFFDKIAFEIDEYRCERERVNNLVNYYKDGNNCERILRISGIYIT